MPGIDLEQHVCVFGQTSCGKTYWFREKVWKESKKRVVFFNAQREAGFGREIEHWDPALITKPGARVNLCPPVLSVNPREKADPRAIELLARVYNDLVRIGDKVTHGAVERTGGLVVLGVDDAHLYSPKSSQSDPLARTATNGNRYGIKLVALTTRPAMLSETVISQSPVKVHFRLEQSEDAYLQKKYAMPDDIIRWTREPAPGGDPDKPNRRFAVKTGETWTRYRPV